MQNETTSLHAGSPLIGVVMMITGMASYCYGSLVKLFASPPPTLFAQAVPGTHLTWADIGQVSGGALTVVGGVILWVLSKRSEIKQNLRDERDKDEAAARAKVLQDGMVDIKLFVARKMAEYDVLHAEMNSRLTGQLTNQDRTLEVIKDAVQTTGEPTK